MFNLFLRAGLIAIASMGASLAAAYLIVPLRGGTVDGTALLLTILCPLAIAFPASFHALWQKRRLRGVLDNLRSAHEDLAAAHAALSEKSRRDPMTGLLTRDAFLDGLDQLCPVTTGGLLVAALRNTRSINDRFGYRAGDEALMQVADAVHRACGEAEMMGRLSDNEIAVYLPETDHLRLMVARERIHWEISRAELVDEFEQDIPLVVAVATTLNMRDGDVTTLLRRADRTLADNSSDAARVHASLAA